MPRVYLTLEEKRDAEIKKREEKQNRELRSILHDRIYRKISYEYIRNKTGFAPSTIVKIVNHPERATVAQLRAICAIADISLTIVGE